MPPLISLIDHCQSVEGLAREDPGQNSQKSLTFDQADAFANELLTGDPSPNLKAVYGMTAEKLASAVRQVAPKKQIDPAVFALVYGHNADRMPVAVKALSLIQQDSGARVQIRRLLNRNISMDNLSDTDAHLLEQLLMGQQTARQEAMG